MRELKFRRFSDYGNDFLYYDLRNSNDDDYIGFNSTNYPIEQYTGLKDKNGKEIYEGDIILAANHGRTPYVVIYREWDCSFVCKNENIVDFVHMFKTMPQCYKIIGNIHENPKLLDKEEK